MLATLLCAAALVTSRGDERLDELIERSRSLASYSASYTLKFEVNDGVKVEPPPDRVLRIDFVAPDKVRVENRVGAQQVVTWCTGSLLATQFRGSPGGKGDMFGAVDLGAVRAGLAPLQEQLRAAFPAAQEAKATDDYDGPSALVNWSFDSSAKRANFELVAASAGVDSPLGWLDTLRRKGAVLESDGDVLRFRTDDGHFRGELDAADGALRLLQGESPNGRFFLRLESRAPEPLEAASFVPPSSAAGARDTSAELRSSALRGLHDSLRARAYRAVAGLSSFDDSARARARAWLSAFHVQVLDASLATWFELAERKRATIAERLEAYAASGRTPQQVEEQRQRELGALRKGMDELEATFASLTALSARQSKLANSSALNDVERQVFAATFDERVRKRALAELDAATRQK